MTPKHRGWDTFIKLLVEAKAKDSKTGKYKFCIFAARNRPHESFKTAINILNERFPKVDIDKFIADNRSTFSLCSCSFLSCNQFKPPKDDIFINTSFYGLEDI